MSDLHHEDFIVVTCTPSALYEMVSDITRMGEWSPTCRACWWDEGDGPWPGSWFTGHNETPSRVRETRSQVVAAEPGREFAFVVGDSWVRWGHTCTPVDGGTRLNESWQFLPAGISRFHERYGDQAEAEIAERTKAARRDIPATLAAIKEAAERPV